jgi:hypothetical protein
MTKDYSHDISELSPKENYVLTADFYVEEVHDAIFHMEHDKAQDCQSSFF